MMNWEPYLKLNLLQLHEKLLKNSTWTILRWYGFWSKLERWKSLTSGCLVSWPKIKKQNKTSFWSVIVSYSIQLQWTIFLSNCAMQWKIHFIGQPDQLSGWTKRRLQSTSKSQTWTHTHTHTHTHTKLMITVWWSVAHLIHYSFLNPGETSSGFWQVRSANQWDTLKTAMPAAGIGHWSERAQFSMTMLDHKPYNQCFESSVTWASKFCLICHIQLIPHQLTTNS